MSSQSVAPSFVRVIRMAIPLATRVAEKKKGIIEYHTPDWDKIQGSGVVHDRITDFLELATPEGIQFWEGGAVSLDIDEESRLRFMLATRAVGIVYRNATVQEAHEVGLQGANLLECQRELTRIGSELQRELQRLQPS